MYVTILGMSTEPTGPGPFQPVKSADRALDVLEALARAPHRRALGQLARELGIPKSSLHGILRTMARRGWVETDPGDARFGLGVRALQVGAAYVEADDTISLLTGVLDELAAEFGETVHLGRLDGADVVYLAKRESTHPLRLFSAIGRRLPAHATALGKALLAERPENHLTGRPDGRLTALTRHTITDPDALRADLTATRERGYAVDREENTDGIVCFAVAVPLRSPAVDAISVSVPASRVDAATATAVPTALRRVADRLRSARSLF